MNSGCTEFNRIRRKFNCLEAGELINCNEGGLSKKWKEKVTIRI